MGRDWASLVRDCEFENLCGRRLHVGSGRGPSGSFKFTDAKDDGEMMTCTLLNDHWQGANKQLELDRAKGTARGVPRTEDLKGVLVRE